MPDYPVIFFDGVCNLCNGTIDFIIRRDGRRRFRYASLQSEAGIALCQKHGYPTENFESIILQEGEQVSDRSTAILRIAKELGGVSALLYILILVPRFIRDPVYIFISQNRYRWFGKRDSCRLPTPDERQLFL